MRVVRCGVLVVLLTLTTACLAVRADLACIRHHESDRGPWPYLAGYRAQNPRSSASGAYQFLDGTWASVSARAGWPGWPRAMDAPALVQDAVAAWALGHGYRSAWAGTGCV